MTAYQVDNIDKIFVDKISEKKVPFRASDEPEGEPEWLTLQKFMLYAVDRYNGTPPKDPKAREPPAKKELTVEIFKLSSKIYDAKEKIILDKRERDLIIKSVEVMPFNNNVRGETIAILESAKEVEATYEEKKGKKGK